MFEELLASMKKRGTEVKDAVVETLSDEDVQLYCKIAGNAACYVGGVALIYKATTTTAAVIGVVSVVVGIVGLSGNCGEYMARHFMSAIPEPRGATVDGAATRVTE